MARDCLTELEAHQIQQKLSEILNEVRMLHNAFPRTDSGETDLEGHRKYHEAMIKSAQAQEAFWRELRLDIAKKGTWGLLIIVLGLVMAGIAAKFGIAEVKVLGS